MAKRSDSKYEAGLRSGAWQKMRVNRGQELVIAGCTPSAKNFDALVIGYYDGSKLIYAARTRNGLTPSSRTELFKKLKPLQIAECPFANLAEKKAGRWGAGLTAAKMAEYEGDSRSDMKLAKGVPPARVGQDFVEYSDVETQRRREVHSRVRVQTLGGHFYVLDVFRSGHRAQSWWRKPTSPDLVP